MSQRLLSLCWLCAAGSSVVALWAGPAAAEDRELGKLQFLQIRMGIPVAIQVYAADEEAANLAVEAAYTRIQAIDRIMSDYDPDSELMQLCRNAQPRQPVAVSGELAFVLARAQELSRRSCGRFDVTVGPVVDLWRKARRRRTLPDADALQTALRLVGYRNVCVDECGATVTLRRAGMRLDLGAIAKGYAADEALRILRKHGFPCALVDAGGDIVAGDAPPGREGWRIAVEAVGPGSAEPAAARILLIENSAVATSGDAYQFIEIDGTRYSHIVDPRTGLGLTTRSSVTVVASDCMTADSLATAVSVLGPEAGLKLIECTAGAEVTLVVAVEERFEEHESRGFSNHLVPSDPAGD